jgi:transposase
MDVAAALDSIGGLLGVQEFPAAAAGYASLLSWLRSFGTLAVAGVEGTGGYGAGLARHLAAAGVRVVDVGRPGRQDRARQGKSGPAMRSARRGRRCPGGRRGRRGAGTARRVAIRALMAAGRSARQERTQAIGQARALIMTGPEELRARLARRSPARLIEAIAALRPGRATCRGMRPGPRRASRAAATGSWTPGWTGSMS